jgi:gluconate 2-dehydrogenase gamma chain
METKRGQPGLPTTSVGEPGGLMFFNDGEFRTVEAVAARIVPSEPDGLGAREAGAAVYIDRAVAGYFRDLQELYRHAIQVLDGRCRRAHGAPFAELAPDTQDMVLAELDVDWKARSASGDLAGREGFLKLDVKGDLLSRFFSVIRDHTIQGMFCDPMYGGNRDFVGWRLIGFPGAQWAYSAEQMRPGFDATTIPIQSLSDLRREGQSTHD